MTARTTKPAPPTFAQVRARIQRPRKYVDLVLDAAAAAEIDALDALLDRLQITGTDDETRQTVTRSLAAAEQAAEASRTRFVLEAVPHTAYQGLRAAHPATREQLEEARQAGTVQPAFDANTFAPALVHAQLIDPRPASREEFEEFWDELSDGQLSRLWAAALAVQLQITDPRPRPSAATTPRAAGSR